MEWKKAEVHEWAGDSFNRDSSICSYAASSITADTSVTADNVFKINNDGCLTIAKGYYDGTLTACASSLGSVTIRDDFNSLSDTVVQLSISLQQLKDAFEEMNKKAMPRASKLRSALKTLNCKYEVMTN